MNFKVFYTTTKMSETITEVDTFNADSHIFKEGVVVFFNHEGDEAIPKRVYPISGLVKIDVLTNEEWELINNVRKERVGLS